MTVLSAAIERVTWIEDRLSDWLRSPEAAKAATDEPTGDIESFRGRRYCLLITYRRDGTPVPSPLWFGERGGMLYVHTGGWKVKRIANNPNVRIAPCNFRGRPLGPPIEGTARALPASDRAVAEAALDAHRTSAQRLYYATLGRGQHALAELIEITPRPRP